MIERFSVSALTNIRLQHVLQFALHLLLVTFSSGWNQRQLCVTFTFIQVQFFENLQAVRTKMLECVKRVTRSRQSEMKGNHADLLLEALNIFNKKEDDHNTDFDQVINTLHKEIGAGGRRLDILNDDSGGFDFEDDLDEPAVYQGMCYISPASLEHSDLDQAEAELDDVDVA